MPKRLLGRWTATGVGLLAAAFLLVEFRSRHPSAGQDDNARSIMQRGQKITAISSGATSVASSDSPVKGPVFASETTPAPATNAPPADTQPVGGDQDFKPLHFALLSSFPYGVKVTGGDGDGKGFAIVPTDPIPPEIRAYDGKRVKVSGFVLPLGMQARGMTEFLLVRDQTACCFGPRMQANHWIHVTMDRGYFRPSIYLPVTVYGTISVGEKFEYGSLVSIFRMKGLKATDGEVDKVSSPFDGIGRIPNP